MLLKTVEERSYEYDFQIADAFKKIAQDNKVSEAQSKLLETEFIAFRFMTSNDDGKRFRPMAEFTNGTVFPDEKTEVTQERLDDWLKRAAECINPVMRARYYDLNYEFNKKVNKKELAKKVIASYIDVAYVSVEGNEIDRIDSITRAFSVALTGDNEDLKIAKQALIDLVSKFAKDNLRWCLDLIEIIVANPDKFTIKEFTELKKVSEEGAAYYEKQEGTFLILESYLKVDQALASLIDPQGYNADNATRTNAQLYIDQADEGDESLFVQQIHLLQAEKILRDGGLRADANKVHTRVEALARDPTFTSGFQEFNGSFEIPQEQIDRLADSFDKAPDKGVLLAFAPVFMPSWAEAKKQASKDGSMVQDIFTSLVLNDDNMPISADYGDEKQRKNMRHYGSGVMVSSVMTELVVMNAIRDDKFNLEDIMPHLQKINDIKPDTYESVIKGFEHFFKGNYYEALSILLPQIEDLLADVMASTGITRYRQDTIDTVEPKMLGSILTALRKQYGDDAYYFLHYQLIDPIKGNLRNYNGHGKLKVTMPDLDKKALIVLQAYMVVLAPLDKINPQGEKAS